MKGWFGESYRHYLAAKGYFVARKDAKLLTLYHGTREAFVPSIQRRFVVGFVTPEMRIAKAHAEKGPERVAKRVERLGAPVVMRVTVPKEIARQGAVAVPGFGEDPILETERTGEDVEQEEILRGVAGVDEPAIIAQYPKEYVRAVRGGVSATDLRVGKFIKEFPEKGFYRYEYVVPEAKSVKEVPWREVVRRAAKEEARSARVARKKPLYVVTEEVSE